jgi:TonB-dependent SusC/RagA subfamily outer membrane receptor
MQKLQLSIPEPCHESWQRMTPTDQGRFCNACAKEVIDFSMMTDTEVLNYFTSLSNENVCGRALPSQLERTISWPKEPKKRLFWYWNYIVMFFMFFAKGNGAKAQGKCAQTVSVANLNQVKPADISQALGGNIADGLRIINKVIAGRVIDKQGNPVSFASIYLKGVTKGVSADANGAFSIKANSSDMLSVSAAGYKTLLIKIGNDAVINIVLERSNTDLRGEVVVTVAGGVRRRPPAQVNNKIIAAMPDAVFEIKEDGTDLPVEKASVIITRKTERKADTLVTDVKGNCKLSDVKEFESYFVKVKVDGYEDNEFNVDGKELAEKKEAWEILLRKRNRIKVAILPAKPDKQTPIRLGGMMVSNKSNEPIYVVDGTITLAENCAKPEDIADIAILKSPDAMAIFGPQGSNGAIIVTTRKSKMKNLDTVSVTANADYRKGRLGGMIIGYRISYLNDSRVSILTALTDSLKVYPNPVKRGSAFSVSLKLKQAGNYQIQIADITGKLLLQKRIAAIGKTHTESMTADSRWSSGVYYVRVFDNDNRLISKKSFIFE